jgi:hypothetical protein
VGAAEIVLRQAEPAIAAAVAGEAGVAGAAESSTKPARDGVVPLLDSQGAGILVHR